MSVLFHPRDFEMQFAARLRIEASGGLIEQNEFRPVHERECEREALAWEFKGLDSDGKLPAEFKARLFVACVVDKKPATRSLRRTMCPRCSRNQRRRSSECC